MRRESGFSGGVGSSSRSSVGGGSAGSPNWFWPVSLALILAASLCLVSLAVIEARRDRASQPSFLAGVSAVTLRGLANGVFASFSGTEGQRNAGLVLRAYAYNNSMDDCMAANGHPEWDWSLSRQYATPIDSLASGVWLAQPMRPFRSEQLMAQQPRLLAELEMNADDVSEQLQEIIVRCSNSAEPASEVAAESAARPRVAAQLIDEWNQVIGQAAEEAGGSLDKYYACMDAADLSVLAETGLPSEYLGEAVSTLGPSDSEMPSSAPDPLAAAPQWHELLTVESEINEADWSCRQETYLSHIGDVRSIAIQFAEAHQTEILAAQAGWAEIEREATLLGYDGTVGALGG